MSETRLLRLAAGGDWHCDDDHPRSAGFPRSFAAAARDAQVVLLAGDLTAGGEPRQATVVAAACRATGLPVVAVLGNHDHDAGRADGVRAVLEDAGVTLLDGDSCVVRLGEVTVGVAGVTGYAGGFPDAPLEGEPRRAREHAEALEAALRAVAGCDARIAVLHYAPTTATLVGERRELWARLGAEALAAPIRRHRPDLVVHAHAHAGTFRGAIDDVPVFNVSAAVMGRDLCRLDLPVHCGDRTHRRA